MPRNISLGSFSSTNSLCTLFLFFLFFLFPFWLLSADLNKELQNSTPDTIHLSLQQAETLFLEENLLLIAEKLNVDIKDAEIRQARLWENPEIEIEHQIINRERSGPVGFTGSDNTVFEIEQLITTAGKRGRIIQLLELEKRQTEHQFDLLLREFKRNLREEFFQLAFLNRIEGLYQEQIDALERILHSFEEQQQQGNIARLEIIRIRSLLLELQQEYNAVLGDQIESQNALKILLQLQEEVPVPELPDDFETMAFQVAGLDVDELIEIARTSRSDLLATETAADAAQQLLRVERANAFPDVGIGLVYDQLDGPVDNYFGITLNVQLPLWNRNQGNIRAARHQIRQSELVKVQQQQTIRHEIEQSLRRYERAVHLFEITDESYEQDFASIIESLLRQYQNGDIRLIEFIDFYESFRESVIRNYDIREEFLKAAEDLNYTVGRDIFEFNF
jgi:outer membrane protein, heavy metal efflux system